MSLPLFQPPKPINGHFKSDADIVLFNSETRNLLAEIPDSSIQLIITSPPYNLGKDYESRVEKEVYEQRNLLEPKGDFRK
jgi:adenine-specific DNA-methyltransferase